ncbi:uncharacterized protein TNCV_3916851 [Trichonephila clavipes]|nr:uncharacterized protein TNCV_3916851 [Trichonephila clavipes]
MDEVIITSPSFNEHLDHLNQVFTLLRDAGLTLNKDKCHFPRDKLKYLGLIISKDGIETDNNKVKAITEMKPPKNNKEVSKFLGMAGCGNGPQFISAVFEHLSHRLDIKHMKTVTYRPQANLTERVNRTLVQMISCFVEENHDNWDRFLHEFSFALRTAVNETTGKTPAELFLGRIIIIPFRKLINVTDGAEYVGGNIEKLFDEARQNMRKQHKTWEKYYNRKSVLEVRNNILTIWKKGRRVTVNIDQVRVYHPRHSDPNSFDSTNETIYEGKISSNGSIRSHPGKSRRSKKPSGDESKNSKSNKGTAGLEDLRLKQSRRGARVRSDKARETRTTGSKGHSVAEGRAVRSGKTTTVRPCPYYLRSRLKKPEGYQRSTGIDILTQNSLRRRSLSMEGLDGDPADRSA